jgi:2-(1,2-epoxy-1,2-dihydrophenyl)acetyl-CoA isomerase
VSVFEVTREGNIVRFTLNRPEKKNALDYAVLSAFCQAAQEVERDDSVRCIVLTGAGDVFSVGGDINEFVAQKHRLTDHLLDMLKVMHGAVLALRRAPAPVLVAVNGVAAGGGLGLVAGADLAIAKRSAKLVSAFTRSGLTPDSGTSYYLTKLVGRQRAFDLMATNRMITADEALAMGLLARVVDDADFDKTVDEVAKTVASLPSGTGLGVKKLVSRETRRELEEHLEAEAKSMASMGREAETLAKLDAFVAR